MNAAARSSAFCGIVGGGGDMVRVAASLRWGSSARRLRGRRRSRLDVFCLRSLAYEEFLVVHSGLRKRRTGSEDADRRHLRTTSPRLRSDSGLSPQGRQLGEILIIVFSVTVSYAAVAPHSLLWLLLGAAVWRLPGDHPLEGARRFVRTQRRADASDARGGRSSRSRGVPRRNGTGRICLICQRLDAYCSALRLVRT